MTPDEKEEIEKLKRENYKLLSEEVNKSISLNKSEREKFVYYIIAINAACIAFSITQTHLLK